jgi:microcystin-dependent protein
MKDRSVQYPNRIKLTNVSNSQVLGTFDFEREPGTVTVPGTPYSKAACVPDTLATRSGFNPATEDPTIADILATILPTGIVTMWSGAANAIPKGWLLCDGNNGTPNLRDKFVVGAGGAYSVGDTGGEASHVLSANEIPVHNHAVSLSSDGGHSHTYYFSNNYSTSGNNPSGVRLTYTGYDLEYRSHLNPANSAPTASVADHTHTATVSNVGGGLGHENRPPYYALCYIMKK